MHRRIRIPAAQNVTAFYSTHVSNLRPKPGSEGDGKRRERAERVCRSKHSLMGRRIHKFKLRALNEFNEDY